MRMKYSPKGDGKTAFTAFTASLVLTAISVALFSNKAISPWIPQLAAVVFAVCTVQIYLKYILSEYMYAFDEKNLCIDKTVGKKIVTLGVLDLSCSLCEVVSMSEYEKRKATLPKPELRFNYCKTMRAKNPYVYLFRFNGKDALLTFEPNGDFVDGLNAAIKYCLERNANINDSNTGNGDNGAEVS